MILETFSKLNDPNFSNDEVIENLLQKTSANEEEDSVS